MAKQIIKITESDLHDIIRESVNYILKESLEDELELRKQELKAARASGNKKAIIAAAQAYNAAKLAAGKENIVKNPGVNWSDEENAKRGIAKKVGLRRVMGDNDMVKRKEEDRRDREGLKGIKANDIDDILGV